MWPGKKIGRRLAETFYGSNITSRLYRAYQAGWAIGMSRYPMGTNVYDRPWDALILLDTCRVDALREVAPEYDFLSEHEIGTITSRGSTSKEWIANTFTMEHIDQVHQTACVSVNAFMERVLADRKYPYEGFSSRLLDWRPVTPKDFLVLDQPWQYISEEDKHFAHTPPAYLTDRAIAVGREYDAERLIVHYSQPHFPYTVSAHAEDREMYDYEATPFEYLRDGGDRETVWNVYIDCLREVLDEIGVLLDNLDAERVVISADHGEAFGELGLYQHPMGIPHPVVRRVPWAITSANDDHSYTPTVEPPTDVTTEATKEHLKDLGYF